MKATTIVFYIGLVLAFSGLFMLISAGIGLLYSDESVLILFVSGILTAGIGLFPMIFIPRRADVSLREAICVVVFGWIACMLSGAIPFYLYGAPFGLVNAIFESVSGFSTTGSSIIPVIEDLPKGLLFWRAVTQWLGGIGIVAFALTVMPRMGQVSRPLFQQEYSGLGAAPVLARASDIMRGLFLVYVGLTVAQTLLLVMSGLSLYDALTNSLTTLSTGGFCVRNASIAHYNNVVAETIIMFFMVVGGINFTFMFNLLSRPKDTKAGWEVTRTYLLMLLIPIIITILMVKGPIYSNWSDAIRYGSFQVINVATSCGFGTADSSVWPVPAQIIITMVTILGACAGSTGGGIKTDRILLFWKLLKFRFNQIVHPNIVPSIRVDRRVVRLEHVERATFFIAVYLGTIGLFTLILNSIGLSAVDALTGTVACLGNAGPGMGSVGTMESFAHISNAGKLTLSMAMILGRLEILILILPFTRGFWRK